MEKKIYHISGFDCGNCAAKTERHLNSKEYIEKATIDFAANKMYITYKEEPLTIDQLKKVIKEVEDDPLNIYEEVVGQKKEKPKIFTKHMWLILLRVIIATLVTLACIFLLGKEEYNWVRFGLYLTAYLLVGYDVAWKVIMHIKNKTNPIDHNLLITLAAIGAFTLCVIQYLKPEISDTHIIHELGNGYTIAMDHAMDALMVVILFQVGRIIEAVATNKSKAAVMSAVELRVDTANLLTDHGVVVIKPEELEIGQQIIVKVGELIPIDGDIIDGEAQIDTSSLTGEFVPVKAEKGESVFSGCLIKQGQITVEVKKTYANSTVSKIIELITSGGEKKSKADEFIAKFGRVYTPVVMITSLLAIVIMGLITNNWVESVYNGLEILVTGCPCAIVISVPLAYFAAIGLASKHGIVVKGAAYLDKLVNLGVLVTDKTGTLTEGTFSIQVIKSFEANEEELLNALYAVEAMSNHPIGKAICHDQDVTALTTKVSNFKEITGFGVEADYEGHHIVAGNKKLMKKNGVSFVEATEIGAITYVSKDNKFLGYVVLSDQIKESAKETIKLLHNKKVEVVLLTGDHDENARDISNQLGIDRYYSELLPDQKAEILAKEIDNNKKAVAFVGDGVNDAPSIIRSDIGIAMGGIGSDIAVENADLVIMNDDPIKVYDAYKIAKIARTVAMFNIVFSLFVKIGVAGLVLLQNFIDGLVIPMYIAVLADTGLTVLMVLNSLLILYRKIKR